MIRLESPWALAWIAVLIPLGWIWWRSARHPAAVLYGDLSLLRDAPRSLRVRLAWVPRALRIGFVLAAAVALARPQHGSRSESISSFGVDVMVALDRSGSMRALDFKPDRLGAAKRVVAAFIAGRPGDRIGLVEFASEAFTACPLTLDHNALQQIVAAVDIAPPEVQGTAVGLGLAAAISRLDAERAEPETMRQGSRVVILITDGENNSGAIDPETAADLARERGIKLYTIGVGTHGYAVLPIPRPDGGFEERPVPVEIDEQGMTRWANATGGRYFRATDDRALEQVLATIDQLEKRELTSTRHVSWADRFEAPLALAALLLLIELLLARPLLARSPA